MSKTKPRRHTHLCGGATSSVSALYALKTQKRGGGYDGALRRLRRAIGSDECKRIEIGYKLLRSVKRHPDWRVVEGAILWTIVRDYAELLPIVELEYLARRLSALATKLKDREYRSAADQLKRRMRAMRSA